LNLRPTNQPWGGGNNFVLNIEKYLSRKGHRITFDLCPDLDIILLVDFRTKGPQLTFSWKEVEKYFKFHRQKPVVVHRINECDERKGTRGVNRRLRRVNRNSDATIFVSSWLKELDTWERSDCSKLNKVILNGADKEKFQSRSWVPWSGKGPLKIVTHHWSDNYMKGHDLYQELDRLLFDHDFADEFDFTYIGRFPKNLTYHKTRLLPAMSSSEVAKELANHHAYLTASLNEPGSNHQIEAAMLGLPVIYRPSGSLEEYCENFGYALEGGNLKANLATFRDEYQSYVKKTSLVNYDASSMAQEYLDFFFQLLGRESR
jgi:hypothetical protein